MIHADSSKDLLGTNAKTVSPTGWPLGAIWSHPRRILAPRWLEGGACRGKPSRPRSDVRIAANEPGPFYAIDPAGPGQWVRLAVAGEQRAGSGGLTTGLGMAVIW